MSLTTNVRLIPEFEAGQFARGTPVPTWGPILRRLEIAAEWARSPVLDVGAGTGWLALHLLAWGHDVTASDYSDDALKLLRANAQIANAQLPIAKENVSHLSYADAQFASVFCISTLSYVADLQGALAELWRVLKPGGIAIVGCINAYGSFAFMFDRDPRTFWRKTHFRGDIRQDPEHFHSPRWWVRELSRRFELVRVMPIEIFSPVIARFAGYEARPAWSLADTRLAARLPKELASEVIYVLQKPNVSTPYQTPLGSASNR